MNKSINDVMTLANKLGLANDEECYFVSRKMVKSEKKLLLELCWNALEHSDIMYKCVKYYRNIMVKEGLDPEPVFVVEEKLENKSN